MRAKLGDSARIEKFKGVRTHTPSIAGKNNPGQSPHPKEYRRPVREPAVLRTFLQRNSPQSLRYFGFELVLFVSTLLEVLLGLLLVLLVSLHEEDELDELDGLL